MSPNVQAGACEGPITDGCALKLVSAALSALARPTVRGVPVTPTGYAPSPCLRVGGDPRLESLLAALVGGFAGALVTGGLGVWREHRRRLRALRAATRLVAAELRALESRLQAAMASGSWRELRARPLTHGEWDQHRGAFAAQLSLERWSDLQVAYSLVEAIGAAAHLHNESDRLTELEREELRSGVQATAAAATALEIGWATGEPRPGRPLRGMHRILPRHP